MSSVPFRLDQGRSRRINIGELMAADDLNFNPYSKPATTRGDDKIARVDFQNRRRIEDGSAHTAPHNDEQEKATIGGLMLENAALDRHLSGLLPEHFYHPLHIDIFQVMCTLIRAGKPANPITLKPYFEGRMLDDGKTTVIQYLGTLVGNATTTLNLGAYAEDLIELSARRLGIAMFEEQLAALRRPDPCTPVASLLDAISVQVERVRDVSNPTADFGGLQFAEELRVGRSDRRLWRQVFVVAWTNGCDRGCIGLGQDNLRPRHGLSRCPGEALERASNPASPGALRAPGRRRRIQEPRACRNR